MAVTQHYYIGGVEAIFPGYLMIDKEGHASTLIGVPGGNPVMIRRGTGNDHLPEIPDFWAPTESAQQTTNDKGKADK